MADHSRDVEFFSPWLAVSAPSEKGEYRMRCPVHGDRHASASINFGKSVFRCTKPGCIGGMSVRKLKALLREREEHVDEADYNPFESAPKATNVVSLEDKRATKAVRDSEEGSVKELSEALVNGFHRNLVEDHKDLLEAFMNKRGLTLDMIKRFKIGYESKSKRYTIPIRDEQGRVVNIRKYRLEAGDSQKMSNHMGYGSPPRLYPLAELADAENVLIVEGELDALIAIQNGFTAVSGTAGAEKWMPEWSKFFEGKNVVVIYDNDQAGRIGAHRVKQSVRKYAKTVKVIEALCPGEHEDMTDYFVVHGGTARKLRKTISETPEAFEDTHPEEELAEPEEMSLRVVDSMDSRLNGKPMRIVATITGSQGPTRSIPADYVAHCTVDAGAKCKTCPMYQPHEGEFRGHIRANDLDILSLMVEKGSVDQTDIIRQAIGAAKCNMFKVDVKTRMTVEELFVTANVDSFVENQADYTTRRVFNVGFDYDTQANVVANLTGSSWPSPKNARNEFFAWELEPAVTSIDKFEMSDELRDALRLFHPEEGQSCLDKLRDIAIDHALNVTGIVGRERMHMAMDLVFHSPLKYVWRGSEIRGWLEMIVVGDTRTGKSVSARKLTEHYQLGHVISCEGATFAGLIGGNKQVGENWTVQWGDYTINDRRLVVLDEVSGLSYDIISLMSDVRSSGQAQLNKIQHGQTTARVRSIWISNPRGGKNVQEKKTIGIDIIEDVIGNPEDIARFDIAMSVRETDVAPNAINTVFSLGTPKYPQELAQALVLWVWSRKPSQVQFTDAAIQKVFDFSTRMSQMYVAQPGLIQMGNAHEKISRVAASIAARLFSTDETGELIVVQVDHVVAACNFIHRLYSYDNFGYFNRSQRIVRNREIAQQNRGKIKRWLMENPKVLEFLLDRKSSFRSQDMEEMAHLDRDEVRNVLEVLGDAKMVSKDRAQLIMEPELQDLLQDKELRNR